jgi:hypothetical protein
VVVLVDVVMGLRGTQLLAVQVLLSFVIQIYIQQQ